MRRERAKTACRVGATGVIALGVAPRRFLFSTRSLCAEPIPFRNGVRRRQKRPRKVSGQPYDPANRKVRQTMGPNRFPNETACSLRARHAASEETSGQNGMKKAKAAC